MKTLKQKITILTIAILLIICGYIILNLDSVREARFDYLIREAKETFPNENTISLLNKAIILKPTLSTGYQEKAKALLAIGKYYEALDSAFMALKYSETEIEKGGAYSVIDSIKVNITRIENETKLYRKAHPVTPDEKIPNDGIY